MVAPADVKVVDGVLTGRYGLDSRRKAFIDETCNEKLLFIIGTLVDKTATVTPTTTTRTHPGGVADLLAVVACAPSAPNSAPDLL